MNKKFKKEMLEDIRFSTMRCLRYEEIVEREERDEDILAALDDVKLFANVLIQKIDYYKNCWDEDNQQNEKQEDVIS